MARTLPLKLNGTTYNMPVTYKASKEIAEKVGDPLRMAVEANAGKLQWNQEQIITILHIGATNAGCSLDRDQVGEYVVEHGLVQSSIIAAEYIGLMVGGGPERPVTGGASKKPSRGST